MRRALRVGLAIVAIAGWLTGGTFAQSPVVPMPPVNDLPNLYTTIEGWAKMPQGRTWGSTSAVDIDKDGKTVWVAERCGVNSCWDAQKREISPLDVVLHFDATGKLVKSFGAGMFAAPHGIHVDAAGNIWVTDYGDNLPRRRPGSAPTDSLPPPPAKIVGNQVYKFSPDGQVLLMLGKAGGNQPNQPADPGSFYQPNDVITYSNGDIVVAEGHGGANARLVKFDKTGKFLMEFGKKGSATEGEFDQPHGMALDSKGRLFVADRSNNRIQVLDAQTFKTLDTWYQFSRLSGIYISEDDTLYGADSESGSVSPAHGAWKRGIRIGSARDGKVVSFIPDPTNGVASAKGTLAAEGVAVDKDGVIYGAEVGPRALKRYVEK